MEAKDTLVVEEPRVKRQKMEASEKEDDESIKVIRSKTLPPPSSSSPHEKRHSRGPLLRLSPPPQLDWFQLLEETDQSSIVTMYTQGLTKVQREVQQKFQLSSQQLETLTQWLNPSFSSSSFSTLSSSSSSSSSSCTTTTTTTFSSTTGADQQSKGRIKIVEGSVVYALQHDLSPRFICHQENCQSGEGGRGKGTYCFFSFPF